MRLSKCWMGFTLGLVVAGTGMIASTLPVASQQFSWGSIFSFLRRSKPPFTSRGDLPCALSPVDTGAVALITSSRPTFLWRGSAYKVAVRTPGAAEELWAQEISDKVEKVTLRDETLRRLQYPGKPLQAGQTYEFLLYYSNEVVMRTTFKVLLATEQAKVAAQRATIAQHRQSKEEIILQQVQTFTQENLWSDAIVAAYSVKNPSGELMQVQQEIPDKVCKEPKS